MSLLPPPCDEFTTSEPLRSATRVSPPGTIVTLIAVEHVGPQVDVARLDRRLPTKQAARDSASVGCAMKLRGSARIRLAELLALRRGAVRADQHAVAAGFADGLHDEAVEVARARTCDPTRCSSR